MFKKVCKTFYKSIPLIPVFLSLYLVIIYLSPLSWVGDQLNLTFVYLAAGLSVVSAYSTTLFFEGV